MSPIERFLDKVTLPARLHDCWEWKAGKSASYGLFWFDGRTELAHRFSYEHFIGPVPLGMDILHSCDNTVCVNPRHLFTGTHTDNMHDMINKGRSKSREGGLNNRLNTHLPEGVTLTRNGERYQVFKKCKYLGTFDTIEDASNAFHGK